MSSTSTAATAANGDSKVHENSSALNIPKELANHHSNNNNSNGNSVKTVPQSDIVTRPSFSPVFTKTQPTATRKPVSQFSIFNKLVSELAGKNSLAKFIQYLLQLLVYYSSQSQQSYNALNVAHTILNSKKNNASATTIINLLARNPIATLSYLRFLFLRKYIDRCAGIVSGLSLFRHTLRFGKTPFRLVALQNELTNHLVSKDYGYFKTDAFATNLIDAIYGIVDELNLLFKFRFYAAERYPRVKKFLGKSDEIVWFADILYQLKLGYADLKRLQDKKAQLISEDLEDEKVSTEQYAADIDELNYEIRRIQYGLLKSLCDLLFDAIDLFGLRITKYVYYALGIGSGFFNSCKNWETAKRSLEFS